MTKTTMDAMKALMAADGTMTGNEYECVMLAFKQILSGHAHAENMVLSVPRRITYAEAARRTGLHRNTIHNLVERGKLVSFDIGSGRSAGVTEESLVHLIEDRRDW